MAEKLKLFLVVLIAIGTIIIILSAGSTWYLIGTGDKRNMVSEDQAKEKVYEFLVDIGRDGGFTLKRVKQLLGSAEMDQNPNVGKMWTIDSPFGSFSVSVKTGDVVEYNASEPDDIGKPQVTEIEADNIANKFIQQVYPGFSEYRFELVEKEKTYGYYEYSFQQKKESGELSIFPNVISISVRIDTGMVTDYSCSNLEFTKHTQPKISKEIARQIIEKEIMPYNCVIENLELMEMPVKNAEEARTVWIASIIYQSRKFEYSNIILIDADTGEIVESE